MDGFRVHVVSELVGSKKAIIQGGELYVSPAMYDLMKNANEEELKALLQKIECVEIPKYDFFDALSEPFSPFPVLKQP